ncbi:uncharacterized protein I303_108314 [Kwoniella dejecticola CBS 10117]|uniref:GH18 domain-containing protein n=1 Tax=Kwoniella dejecticola CBS 10117 TaxID=1296121 RepID=A0A1A5ZXR4_9TREE|nr:uncharacterized protein I303_07359 [Kwoniella dejecticola CBS 10117]OBR82597.1 hypothetical protein I303_07359 [Kwoniella dejecticola CBS 10117]
MTPITMKHAIYLTLSIILATDSVVAAGPHNRFGVSHHRRHHARAAAAGTSLPHQETRSTPEIIEQRQQEECTLGAWKCVGSELQRCYNDQWNFVTNCTGTDIVCSDGLYTTGCVWTWSVEQNEDSNQSATSSPPFTASITATATSSATSTTIASITNANLAVQPTAATDDEDQECDEDDDEEEEQDAEDDDDDLPYCEDDEGSDSMSITPTASTVTSAAVASPSVVGGELAANPNIAQDDDDEEECDSSEDDTEDDTSASPTTTSSATTASTSVIGGQLWAGDDNSWENTASATTHDWYNTNDPYSTGTATTTSPHWYNTNDPYPTETASSSLSSVDWWSNGNDNANGNHHGHKSSSASSADWSATTSSSPSWDDGSWSPTKYDSASGATTTDWNNWSGESTSSAAWGQESASSSGKHGKGSASASASASASTGTGGKTTGSPSGSFSSAPHYVIYSDMWLTEMPSVDVLSNFNRLILAFWMTNQGAVDNAQFWEQLDSNTRQKTLTEYHNAGIALMVSAFGSTDSPTSNGADPTQTAQQLAQWVKDYGLDGVDIDYEDMPAMNSAQAVSWIVTFQKELRRQLPAPYIISHAPVAPWFTSAKDYSDGAYVSIHRQTGDGIDFYNIQFYNQGDGVYEDCKTLLFNSGNDWPSTSVFEINSSAGLPLDKIVIGKPLDEGAAANGFVDPSVLNKCVSQAQAKGWNAGVMFWEWTTSAPSIMGTVRGTN